MARALDPDPIFLSDEEIARRVSMPTVQWQAAAAGLVHMTRKEALNV